MVKALSAVVVVGLAMVVVGTLGGGDGAPAAEPPRAEVARAAGRTLAAGPMRVDAVVRKATLRYRVAGRLDPTEGYRLCGPIKRAPNRHWIGVRLWLEGIAGAFGTLTARSRSCSPEAGWLDDHPPTLPFSRSMLGLRPPGAEDFLHATLVGLAGLDGPALAAAAERECGGRARCFDAELDFTRLDREPPARDEDGWTLRPLLRALGRHAVSVRIRPDGFLERLSIAARPRLRGAPRPVSVELRLSRFGEAARVPHVVAYAIE